MFLFTTNIYYECFIWYTSRQHKGLSIKKFVLLYTFFHFYAGHQYLIPYNVYMAIDNLFIIKIYVMITGWYIKLMLRPNIGFFYIIWFDNKIEGWVEKGIASRAVVLCYTLYYYYTSQELKEHLSLIENIRRAEKDVMEVQERLLRLDDKGGSFGLAPWNVEHYSLLCPRMFIKKADQEKESEWILF